jgi:hypothetical protein
MKRYLAIAMFLLVFADGGGVAGAKVVGLDGAPNPAVLGDRVRHTIDLGVAARLEVWVSAAGFEQPGPGTLPAGTWSYSCCPSQTAGTSAWHFRSASIVAPGSFRFTAVARARGTFLSSALAGGTIASVWIRVR